MKSRINIDFDDTTLIPQLIGVNNCNLREIEGYINVEVDFKSQPNEIVLISEQGYVYFRKDRIPKLQTKLKQIEIKKNLGWCDDGNSRFYNRPIKVNKKIQCEKLFRKNHNYNILIPIEYNFKKPLKNKFSSFVLIIL